MQQQAKAGIKPMAGKSQGQQSRCLIQLEYPFYGILKHYVLSALILLGRSFCSRKPQPLKVSKEKNASGMIVFFFFQINLLQKSNLALLKVASICSLEDSGFFCDTPTVQSGD
jgi:hypothetical protein